MKKFAMLIDVQYCTGCHSCEIACQQENSLEAGQYGIKVTEHILPQRDRLMIDYVPYITDLCNACAARVSAGRRPACAKACLAQCMTFGLAEDMLEQAKEAKKPMVFLK